MGGGGRGFGVGAVGSGGGLGCLGGCRLRLTGSFFRFIR